MFITLVKEYVPLIVLGFNAALFLVIKFNDMKHLESAVKRIEKCVEEITKENSKQGERISKIEGTCAANHKR